MKSYVYLHGFASSSASSKAQYFKARLSECGVALDIPELDGGDFEHLTLTGQLRLIEQRLKNQPCVLMGSSMGGYLAALYAERHPEVERLVLLAPAFDFWSRWTQTMHAEKLAAWESTRRLSVFHYGAKRQIELDYGLIEDARALPAYPAFAQPALVFHGRRDDIVPAEYSRTFCDTHANAIFHEFESGHELTNVLPDMWALAKPFLNL